MSEPLRDEVRQWLRKADHDLGSARKLATGSKPYFDTAIYHCQQAAEKAVKAFLTFHETRFERTHDIEVLVSAAARIEPGFSQYVPTGQMLTPYAAIYRYPADTGEPDQAEFEEALQMSESLFKFVLSALPEDVRPSGA